MKASSPKWTREQLKLAFYLYCQLPYGKMNTGNPDIIKLANIIGRSPGSVAMKLVNFASLDPSHTSTGRPGLKNTSAADKQIWDEFYNDWEKLTAECAELLAKYDIDEVIDGTPILNFKIPDSFAGETKTAKINARIGQTFFRKVVLASYQNKCCMSGIAIPDILIASHIVPWSVAKDKRLNPSNGLCLSAIHDRAFDKGLMAVRPEYTIVVSKIINNDNSKQAQLLQGAHGKKITLPEKFLPDRDLLAWHYHNVFIRE
ncbi:MAG: HNH endonuclease [Prevotellaceae bacterium]|jgi:predicted restriction endonuclease|nr:HNH endonuclease [Prevotellaceae bacterium]